MRSLLTMVAHGSRMRSTPKMRRLFVLLSACSVGAAILFRPVEVHADTVTFAGVQFAVDSREEIPDGFVKVVIEGRPYLFPSNGMEKQVVLTYLSDPHLSSILSAQQLTAVVTRGAAQSEPELAEKGVIAAANSRSISPEALSEFLRLVGSSVEGRSIINRAFLAIGEQVREQALCLGLPHLGQESVSTFKAMLGKDAFKVSCYRVLKEQAFAALRQGDVARTEQALRTIVDLGTGDQSTDVEAKRAYRILQQLSRALQQGAHVEIAAAIGSLRSEPFFSQANVTSIPSLILKAAEASLGSSNSIGALYLLAQTDLTARTPQHHALVSQSLRAVPLTQAAAVAKDPIRKGLRLYASKDDTIRADLLNFVSRTAEQLASSPHSRDVEQMREFLAFMVDVRPDPSALNDEVRSRCAAVLASTEHASQARALVSEIQTGVPLSLHLSLLTWEALIVMLSLSLSILVGVIVFVRGGFRRANQTRLASSAGSQSPVGGFNGSVSGDSEAEAGRAFVAYPPEFRGSGRRGEIESLLNTFGLPPDASIKEIKNAYRNSVKAVHPDRNLLAPEAQSDQFIELTKKYERLLELLENQPKGE